jgi:hypothetical protein
MSNIHKFTENIKTTYGKASTALGSETSDLITSAAFVDMENYDLAVAVVHVTNVASGKIVTLRLYEATASGGTGSASLAISDTFTASATSDTDVLVAQVRAAQLSSGYQYVGWKASTDDTTGAEIVGGVTLQLRASYPQASLV